MIYITIKITNLYKKIILDYPNLKFKNGGLIDKNINLLTYNHTGLGNNLFQISNCLVTAWKYNIHACFPDINLLKKKLPNYKLNIYRKLNQQEFKYRINYPNLNVLSFKDSIIEIKNKEFFYRYLMDYKDKLKDIFSIDQESAQYINTKYPNLFQDNITISLHVRRGDFVIISELYNSEYSLKESYYQNALNYINNKIKNYKLLIFSDDIEWCKETFKQKNIIFIENNDDYIDLWMMSISNHNIISSSTFSWWSAFLNKNKNKIVVVPEKSVFREKKNLLNLNKNYYPKDWIILKE